MFILVWQVLNVVLWLGLLYAWARAVRALWQTKQQGLAILLVAGSLLISGRNRATAYSAEPLGEIGAVAQHQIHQELAYAPGVAWNLNAVYYADSTGIHTTQGSTSISGTRYGLCWQPTAFQLNEANGKLRYTAAGNLEYCLLGTVVYREPARIFEGEVTN